MSKPRILLGDDHSLVLEGMRSVLSAAFEIVGVATNGQDVVSLAEELKPDAVVLDISMPLLNGIEAGRQIKEERRSTKIIFVTQASDRAYIQAAFQIGGSAYVVKQSVASELVTAVKEALEGHYFVSESARGMLNNSAWQESTNPAELFGFDLTTRQREVLQLLAEGKSNKEIAGVLDISVKTVEFHKSRIMDGLGLRTTAELTRYAMEHGLVGGGMKRAHAGR